MKKILSILLLILVVFKTEAQVSVFPVIDSLLQKGNYKKALSLLETTKDQNSLVFEKTADIYQTIGNYNKAILNYTKAIEVAPKDQLKTKLANVYSTLGYKQKAIDLYEDVLEKDSTNLLIANNLGKLYLKNLKPKSAESIYRYLKAKDSLNPNYPYQLGNALAFQPTKRLQMGQSYIDAYNIDTLHLNSIYEIAKFFKNLNVRDTSRMFIDRGLKIDSTNINFLQLKANDQYFGKEFKEAIITLKKLEKLKYKSVNTYEMYGMSYFNLEQIDSAEVYFKKALRLERQNPKILYRLGTIEYQRDNFKLARLYTMQAIMFSKPDLDKQYLLMGTMAKDEYNLKEAVDYFEKAYKNNPSNLDALFEFAFSCDGFYKDKRIALKHYERFIERINNKSPKLKNYAIERSKIIRKDFFMDGVIVD